MTDHKSKPSLADVQLDRLSAASPGGSAGLDAIAAFDQTGVGAIASTSIDDGHSWVRSIDPALTSVVWCQWCGTHQVEVADWLDNPQCKGILAARALASALPSLIDADKRLERATAAYIGSTDLIRKEKAEAEAHLIDARTERDRLLDAAFDRGILAAQLTEARSKLKDCEDCDSDYRASLRLAEQQLKFANADVESLRLSRDQAIAAIEGMRTKRAMTEYEGGYNAAVSTVLRILQGSE